ncbi:ring-cleaving dioxygenase [Mesorhizobium sp. B2-3-5]|nr:ring-cleaving dioxygenase [Mesorhizobium sp. B2-3-5]
MIGRGLHHVTVIATDAARNLDFYSRFIGMRLEKRTVTHEDPGAYHLIYGRGDGAPGGHLSFFSWASATAAAKQSMDAELILLGVAPDALDWWESRLTRCAIPYRREHLPLCGTGLILEDPDHAQLALVAAEPISGAVRRTPGFPAAVAVNGLVGVSLSIQATGLMGEILTDVLGFTEIGQEGDWTAFSAHAGPGGKLYLHRRRGEPRARLGAGAIHHVAFRAKDEADQSVMAEILMERFGIAASPPKDRYYFRSIYFRGPDGLLIEISTDGPGFLLDETQEELGTRLILPPGLADRQEELMRLLPPLD